VHRSLARAALLASALLLGCQTTEFHERELLGDRSMQPDADSGLHYMRGKLEAAREGALGGFGSNTAGGCGCQ
jgi:hypothetical protein